jgi:catechol 2,3-dioxygenase
MSASLRLTAIRLRVPDLSRSTDFYTRQLGFVVVETMASQANLAVAPNAAPLLTLTEQPNAPASPRGAAGLFHAAMLFPTRSGLATWLQATAAHGVDFEGFSDHAVSDAIYLSDPDGNGLEFYADRPKSTWPFEKGEVAMTTRPLAVRGLLAEANGSTSTPLADCSWGHLHLRVTDLERSEAFYRDKLGLEVTQRSFPGARFMAANGYHHHLGLNTWGSPRLSQPPGALGLAEATFALPGVAQETVLTDPDGINLRLQPALIAA